MTDEEYMNMALDLAEEARGKTSPNPMVGCVLVSSEGEIVGRGYHHKAGEPHAEIMAMRDAGDKTKGATAYVTLEPCSHFGKTGPCCEALIKAGIKKVVAAADDPNPKVSGKGFARLREEGVEVVQHVLEPKARRQNEVFMCNMEKKRPFVAMKYAMTLDGKIATHTGDSKWITGVEARTKAHYLRSIYDAILVGKNTIVQDDPELTCRLVEGKNPVRVVIDSRLTLPPSHKIFTDKQAKTVVIAGYMINPRIMVAYTKDTGATIYTVKTDDEGKIDLKEMLETLAKEEGITSILVEGGSTVHGAFLDAGLVDRVYAFVAPKIVGGEKSLSPVGGKNPAKISDGISLTEVETTAVGQDILVTGVVQEKEAEPCSQG